MQQAVLIYILTFEAPRQSSPYLTSGDNDGGCLFRSTRSLCNSLGIYSPYCTCIVHAPGARNAPHCSRHINKYKQVSVPDLLAPTGRRLNSLNPSRSIAGGTVLLRSLRQNRVGGIKTRQVRSTKNGIISYGSSISLRMISTRD